MKGVFFLGGFFEFLLKFFENRELDCEARSGECADVREGLCDAQGTLEEHVAELAFELVCREEEVLCFGEEPALTEFEEVLLVLVENRVD